MFIPKVFYGTYSKVNSVCKRITNQLKNDNTFQNAIGMEMVDTDLNPGLILLHGPNPLLAKEVHFQSYLMHLLIRKQFFSGQLSELLEQKIFLDSLQYPWSLLGLLSQPNVMWIYSSERHHPIIKACLQYWDEFTNTGNRFSDGLNIGQQLWSVHNNLHYILANKGVSSVLLNDVTLDSEHIKRLLEQTLDLDNKQ